MNKQKPKIINHSSQSENLQNVGVEFKIRVHSQRWNHGDNYNLEKTENGNVLATMKSHQILDSDEDGSTCLEKALTSGSISFPIFGTLQKIAH